MYLFDDAGPGLVVRSFGEGRHVVKPLLLPLQPGGVLAREPVVHQHAGRRQPNQAKPKQNKTKHIKSNQNKTKQTGARR